MLKIMDRNGRGIKGMAFKIKVSKGMYESHKDMTTPVCTRRRQSRANLIYDCFVKHSKILDDLIKDWKVVADEEEKEDVRREKLNRVTETLEMCEKIREEDQTKFNGFNQDIIELKHSLFEWKICQFKCLNRELFPDEFAKNT